MKPTTTQISTYTKTILLILSILSLSSCSLHIEKRIYRKGYYVEVNKKERNQRKNESNDATAHPVTKNNNHPFIIKNEVLIELDSTKSPATVSIPVSMENSRTKKTPTHPNKIPILHKKDNQCDIIKLFDGTQIEALIISLNDKEVGYKKCNFADGPTFKISNSRIKEIELKNGEIYKPHVEGKSPFGVDYSKPTGGMITGIVLAIIAFIALIIGIALVLIPGSGGFSGIFINAIPLAIAGIVSLVGLIMSARFLQKGTHPLGKAAFYVNLIVQVLAIIFTVLMFFL